MLVATRDPVPQHGSALPVAPAHAGSRAGRLMFVVQLAGSLLAIPVALASGYSIYRTNFAPEATCQILRNNIIAMIDKQIDASTRRMLVRRDVEEFEKTCASVDPDAEAAFKSLIASGPPPQLKPAVEALAPMPASDWRKNEPAASKPVKETKAKEPKDPKEHEARAEVHEPSSDARWLDAVRHALTTHEAERAAREATVKPLVAPASLRSTPALAPTSAPVTAAPALPPPSSVAAPSKAATSRADDHPVPPASIPENAMQADPVSTGTTPKQTSWTDHIPIFGR